MRNIKPKLEGTYEIHRNDPAEEKLNRLLSNLKLYLKITEVLKKDICLVGSLCLYLESLVDNINDLDFIANDEGRKQQERNYKKLKSVQRIQGIDFSLNRIVINYKGKNYAENEIISDPELFSVFEGFKLINLEAMIACWLRLTEGRFYRFKKYAKRVRLVIKHKSLVTDIAISKLGLFGYPSTKRELNDYLVSLGH